MSASTTATLRHGSPWPCLARCPARDGRIPCSPSLARRVLTKEWWYSVESTWNRTARASSTSLHWVTRKRVGKCRITWHQQVIWNHPRVKRFQLRLRRERSWFQTRLFFRRKSLTVCRSRLVGGMQCCMRMWGKGLKYWKIFAAPRGRNIEDIQIT